MQILAPAWRCFGIVLLSLAVSSQGISAQQTQQRKTAKSSLPIVAYNYQWTTFQNGSADLSFSVRNNTKALVSNVKYRLVFLDRNGDPINYEEGTIAEIEPGLAVMETKNIFSGGLNLRNSTARFRFDVLSHE